MTQLDKALRIAEIALDFGRVQRGTAHPDGTPESDATHTVMLALLALELAPDGVDPFLAVVYALVHDLPEWRTGDVNTAYGLTDEQRAAKAAREIEAIAELESLGLYRIAGLLRLYECQHSQAARVVRYLDKITPKLTHLLNRGLALRKLGMTAERMRQAHDEQGRRLGAEYPELHQLHELFDDACDRCEAELTGELHERQA